MPRRPRITQKRKPKRPAAQKSEWWSIRRILNERRVPEGLEYLVDWVENSSTGEDYDPSWVPASDVLEDAIVEWEHIKQTERSKDQPSTHAPETTGSSKESQPVRPANYRRGRRRDPKDDDDDDDEARNTTRKRPRIDPSSSSPGHSSETPTNIASSSSFEPVDSRTSSSSVEPVPSITSSSTYDVTPSSSYEPSDDDDETSRPRRSVFVEIKNDSDFDASEYLSVHGSQSTSHPSQPLSELESQDQRIAIASQLSQHTIPDSQDPSSFEIAPSQYGGTSQNTTASSRVIVPDSQRRNHSIRPGSSPRTESAPSTLSRGVDLSPGGVILASTPAAELEIPSGQHGHSESQGLSSAKIATSHRTASTASRSADSQPVFFTQPGFPTLSRNSPQYQPAGLSQSSGSLQKDQPIIRSSGSDSCPQQPESPNSAPSQAAQVLNRDYELAPAESRGLQVVSFGSAMEPSEENEPGFSDQQHSRLSQLRNLWDEPSNITGQSAPAVEDRHPSESVGGIPDIKFTEAQDHQSAEQAAAAPSDLMLQPAEQTDAWRPLATPESQQPVISSMRDLVNQVYGAPEEESSAQSMMPPSAHDSHQGTVSPADVSKPAESERSLALLPSLPVNADVSSAADFISPSDAVTMGQVAPEREESSGSMEEELPPTKDHVVTLPMQASIRQLYNDTLMGYKKDITSFSGVFSSPEFVAPEDSLVNTIVEMFGRLQNLCDYPEDIIGTPIENMPLMEKIKYSLDANCKFNFLYELLHSITKDTTVLIVARSVNLLRPLCDLMDFLEFSCTCDVLSRAPKDEFKSSTVRATLALPDTHDPFGFDVVIGYDSAFGHSETAAQLESTENVEQLPLILRLVASYTIEHIDASIADVPDTLERKNMLLIGLVKTRNLILDPPPSIEPYEVAKNFIDYLNGDMDGLPQCEPSLLPEEALDFYTASQQMTEQDDQAPHLGADNDRKRRIDEEGDVENKRMRRFSRTGRPPDTIPPPLTTAVRMLLERANFKDATPDKPQISVPLTVLEALAAHLAEAERAAEANDVEKEYKSTIDRLDKQVKEFEASAEQTYDRLRSAIQDRTEFESKARKAEAALEAKTKTALKSEEKAAAKIADLEAKIARLTDDSATGSTLGATEKLLQDAQDKVKTLEKRLETAHNNEEYARKLYQDASTAGSSLRGDNDELKEQNEELKKKAADNLRNIQEMQRNNTAKTFTRQIAELNMRNREMESELDRVREELRQLKNGRRETRGVSVPQSPRMGVMSPRGPARSAISSASRGASPSPAMGGFDTGSLPVPFTSPQGGNGRWGHLR